MREFRILTVLIVLCSCSLVAEETGRDTTNTDEFNRYWYSGTAEISTYELEQARYGELHEGQSVLVFVTEDFLTGKQVKKETSTDEPAESVLKMNKIDRFTTGIYDYSIMLSSFVPVHQDGGHRAIKTTFSSQDWCGQSWMQTNRTEGGYRIEQRSYFEIEGDQVIDVDEVLLEDALWNLMRIAPRALPQGEVRILPSAQQLRLRHDEVGPMKANAQLRLEVDDKSGERFIYHLTFENGREMQWFIMTDFPHRILGWEEKARNGFGPNAKWSTTKAAFKTSIRSAYWGKNSRADESLREQLGLD